LWTKLGKTSGRVSFSFGEKALGRKKERVVHVGMWIGNGELSIPEASENLQLLILKPIMPEYDI